MYTASCFTIHAEMRYLQALQTAPSARGSAYRADRRCADSIDILACRLMHSPRLGCAATLGLWVQAVDDERALPRRARRAGHGLVFDVLERDDSLCLVRTEPLVPESLSRPPPPPLPPDQQRPATTCPGTTSVRCSARPDRRAARCTSWSMCAR